MIYYKDNRSPAIYKFAPGVAIESIEFCEAARFSMYINSRCIAFPCSFGIEDDTFSVNLKQHSLQEAWESESFAKFREKQTKVCANCTTGICRSCGLELGLNLCGNIKGNLQQHSNPAPLQTKKNPLKSIDFRGFWSEWSDSNARPREPKSRALPTALHPDIQF